MTRTSLIPARRALIGWSYAEDGKGIGKVIVIEQDPTKPPSYLGPPEWQECTFTAGACDMAWLRPGAPDQTPAGVFGDMLTAEGFANPGWAEVALREFAKIAGCDWARTMARAMPLSAS